MNKRVLLTVMGSQAVDGEEPQIVELKTEGTMTLEEGNICLRYDQQDESQFGDVTTTLSVREESVALQRSGGLNSTMIFQLGVKNESLYDMGFGSMKLGVITQIIDNQLGERGGTLYVQYLLELDGVPMSENAYEIGVIEQI